MISNIAMAHGPPRGILDRCPRGSLGCEDLLQAVSSARGTAQSHFAHTHRNICVQVVDRES